MAVDIWPGRGEAVPVCQHECGDLLASHPQQGQPPVQRGAGRQDRHGAQRRRGARLQHRRQQHQEQDRSRCHHHTSFIALLLRIQSIDIIVAS